MKFRDLEELPFLDIATQDGCSLDEWYVSVRDVPINELAVGDICRALRQELFTRYVLPVAVALLSDDVLAGDRYDGELLVALAGLNEVHWRENTGAAIQVNAALAALKDFCNDSELLKDASSLMKMLDRIE
ncbi:contact-dependent growth inhibition system immunity protein [Pseudomonas fluorescens]|uniref:contact-dependent growth inhibition system immunity protein n=1 Tax=Pseudomonas fluorescens TaxID=294 RepID=UPI001398F3B1|nr:contact-dependent growth inhibition system immunity protein [Pseudomonas fluorescens]QIA03874.1 hypothetical protein GZH78_17555 [Pseudomonas fluorescens]